ncbi:MAG: hypothetical protein JWM80_1977 [Cyanobacteria bacterium RYN_339]|nr:hypothetical protein [Cyanobacteria bacterium RYN_339]
MTSALVATSLFLAGCPLHWVVQDDPNGEGQRVRELVIKHRAQLEKAVGFMNASKVAIPLRETRLLNYLTFEIAHEAPALAAYTNGKDVGNNMTRYQRAVGSLGDDADGVLRALDRAGLLEPNPDYATVKLGMFYRVKDAIMSSDLGGTLTAEGETATFYFPLAAAKAFAERQAGLRELVNASRIVGEGDQPLTGHM